MPTTKKIPCDKALDNGLNLLLEGYPFIQNRCKKYKSDIFATRILGKHFICISGKDAAKVFYDENYFERKNVAPMRIQKTLFGQNGVQGLDGKTHKARKQMFMSIMTPDSLENLSQYTKEQFVLNSIRWNNKSIVLFDETQVLLCQVACRWAGVPLDYKEIKQRASDLGKMIDGFGGIGIRYLEGKCARKRSEEWIRTIIKQIRTKKLTPPKGSAADIIANHRDQDGSLLNQQIAAVELLNIIRPIVAIATYVTFGALAMFDHPECKKKFKQKDKDYDRKFVQEVRRYYPFTPFVGARVKKSFLWNQYLFKKGTLVLLDIYGINHDSRLWANPYHFIPERFNFTVDDTFLFMPQGGGDYHNGHRCAGEMVTIETMIASLDYLAKNLTYKVPKQDLSINLSRIPTLPKNRFIISKIQRYVD